MRGESWVVLARRILRSAKEKLMRRGAFGWDNSRSRRALGVGVSGREVTDLGLGNLLGVRLAQVPHRHDVVVSVIHHHQLVPSVLYVTEKTYRLFLYSTRFNHTND